MGAMKKLYTLHGKSYKGTIQSNKPETEEAKKPVDANKPPSFFRMEKRKKPGD